MVTQAPDAAAIEEFAEAIGDWLLTQRFGQIQPLAHAHSLWEPRPDDRLDGELPHLVIDLLVADPPAPPAENAQPVPPRRAAARMPRVSGPYAAHAAHSACGHGERKGIYSPAIVPVQGKSTNSISIKEDN